MQLSNSILKISLFVFCLMAISCKKNNAISIDKNNYFRLQTFEVGVQPAARQVEILFQVTDYYRNGISNLSTSDFLITENGGTIDSEASLKIEPDSIPFTLKTVLLLDFSSSVKEFIPEIKDACKTLVNQKMETQSIAIYTFDSGTKMILDFTKNKQELIDAIEDLPENELINSTNLYGAVLETADLWEESFSIDKIDDGNLIIFTDGRHNATQALDLSDAVAATDGKKVFVAALNSVDLDENALMTLADREDRYFKAENISALEAMFSNIQNEIVNLSNSIYFMYYQSPITDPTPFDNKLKIQVRNNTNPDADRQVVEIFSSEGFGN